MRISDWSSDVCSSDLAEKRAALSELIDAAEARRRAAADTLAQGETRLGEADKALKAAEARLTNARENRIRAEGAVDRKSTRLNSITNAHLVCRLLLEKNKK